jgi:hypothetical protein
MNTNMNVEVLEFQLEDLFTLTKTNFRKSKSPILSPSMNLKARSKNHRLGGFGIYGITFSPALKNEYLIYLGKFQGSVKHGRFGGNIISTRWQKHLYTITMRGHNVAIDSERAFDRVRSLTNYSTPSEGNTFISLSGDAKSKLFQKNGCQASFNRMMFALQNEHLLNPKNGRPERLEHFYKLFKFYYWRVYDKNTTASCYKKVDLREVEDGLIYELSDRLPCNKEYKKSNNLHASLIHYDPNKMITTNSPAFERLSKNICDRLTQGHSDI